MDRPGHRPDRADRYQPSPRRRPVRCRGAAWRRVLARRRATPACRCAAPASPPASPAPAAAAAGRPLRCGGRGAHRGRCALAAVRAAGLSRCPAPEGLPTERRARPLRPARTSVGPVASRRPHHHLPRFSALVRAGGLRRRGGQALLQAPRRGLEARFRRRPARHPLRRLRPGLQHDPHAAGAQRVERPHPRAGEDTAPQDAGDPRGEGDRAQVQQEGDPRAVPEQHLLRRRRLRHRGGGARLLSPLGEDAVLAAGRHAGGAAARAGHLRPARPPGPGAPARRVCDTTSRISSGRISIITL